MTKSLMEIFLDEFLNDYSYEEIFEHLDLDIYELLELAFNEGLVSEETVEELLGGRI